LAVDTEDDAMSSVAVVLGFILILEDVDTKPDLLAVVESDNATDRLAGIEVVPAVAVQAGYKPESVGCEARRTTSIPGTTLEDPNRKAKLRESNVDAAQQALAGLHDVGLDAFPPVLVQLHERAVRRPAMIGVAQFGVSLWEDRPLVSVEREYTTKVTAGNRHRREITVDGTLRAVAWPLASYDGESPLMIAWGATGGQEFRISAGHN
jgi:hypothetical protein